MFPVNWNTRLVQEYRLKLFKVIWFSIPLLVYVSISYSNRSPVPNSKAGNSEILAIYREVRTPLQAQGVSESVGVFSLVVPNWKPKP